MSKPWRARARCLHEALVLTSLLALSGAPGCHTDDAPDPSDTVAPADTGRSVLPGAFLSDPRFRQGTLIATAQPLDIGLAGFGFLIAEKAGERRYIRGGSLHVDEGGRVVDGDGFNVLLAPTARAASAGALTPWVLVEVDGARRLPKVGFDGSIHTPTGSPFPQTQGYLPIVHFAHPEALVQLGPGVFVANDLTGPPLPGLPGESLRASVVPGAFETLEHTVVAK